MRVLYSKECYNATVFIQLLALEIRQYRSYGPYNPFTRCQYETLMVRCLHIFSCRYRVNATRKRKNFVVLSNQAEWQRDDDGQNHVVKIGEKEKLSCEVNRLVYTIKVSAITVGILHR